MKLLSLHHHACARRLRRRSLFSCFSFCLVLLLNVSRAASYIPYVYILKKEQYTTFLLYSIPKCLLYYVLLYSERKSEAAAFFHSFTKIFLFFCVRDSFWMYNGARITLYLVKIALEKIHFFRTRVCVFMYCHSFNSVFTCLPLQFKWFHENILSFLCITIKWSIC